ncbi:response regulator transcription factor [Segetibacter sp. 3557_3]|uniref:LytR/AlgR family response regulator transcription factor n=1 Tax=Segetibacter sp. 3557_3 TaxID=2547429 RepID=UPI00105847D1|nr:LytTR family DNA-binding domain-containing protein [Segetibacter sp. 3557_3]TDH26914.1 response regulator transcription factor [Segetibacter sp. 3557_3]
MDCKIRCLVVDDEPWAMELISDYVLKTPELELVYKTTSPIQALLVVQQGGVDLIFVDIQMPELTGIQLMQAIWNNCKIIITTAYTEYAIDGFEYDVVDYLLKPVTYDRFLTAIQKLLRISENRQSDDAVQMGYILVKTDNRLQKVKFSSIRYIEGLRDYIAIHTWAGKMLTLENLKNMEAMLPADKFLRIHKSYIVSIDKITAVSKGKVVIDDVFLPIGDTYKKSFMSGFVDLRRRTEDDS